MYDIKISVVIVSYNNLKVLVDCINSIYKFNDIDSKLEIIVIDNSSNDEIYKFVKYNYKEIITIKNDNKGFGEGNNVGVKLSHGEYIIFLNPDTILIEPVFQYAIERFENSPSLSLFGVNLLGENLKSNMSFYFIDKHGFFMGQLSKILNKINLFLGDSMFISGANMFVRKNDFMEVGMFDENIFMYYEEPDLIKRLKLNGGEIKYFKGKSIIHLEGKMTENNEAALKRRMESANYYCKKYALDFNKQVKSEIHYNTIKYIIYKIFRNEKQSNILESIKIIKEYGEDNG